VIGTRTNKKWGLNYNMVGTGLLSSGAEGRKPMKRATGREWLAGAKKNGEIGKGNDSAKSQNEGEEDQNFGKPEGKIKATPRD